MKDRLARLEAHQATIDGILNAGEEMLRSPDRDAAALARRRWELARALMAYQGFKHREIFDPLAARGKPDQTRAALRLKAECLATGEVFRAYVARWSGTDVQGRWEEYHPAALAMVGRLRDHLARERKEVERLLR